MKKKLLPLIGGVALLAVLLCVYAVKSGSKEPQAETKQTTEDISGEPYMLNSGKYTLCDKNAEDLQSVELSSQNGTLRLEYKDGSYVAEDYEGVKLNMSNAAGVASTFIGLYSDNKIEDEDRTKYSLDKPLATGKAAFGDGSSLTLALGALTADKKYYYMESSEADGIYLVDAVVGGRLLYTVKDLTDKTIASIKPNYVNYIQVTDNSGNELLMYYDEAAANANTTYAEKGLSVLTMAKPIEGAAVYPYNLTGSILSTCTSLTLSSVADPQPEDYSVYGLDNPRLTVRLRDNSGSLELKVGNAADETDVYVLADDRATVFTMDAALLKPFENYTVTDFIEKFVALHTRSQVNYVRLEGEMGSFALDFKAEGDNKITTDEEGKTKDKRLALINGKAVEGDDFTAFYELLAGLTFDQIGEHTQKEGAPAVTLTYSLMDGSEQVTEFYTYNDNFYSVGKDGRYDMIVNKQSVKQIADRAAALSQ